MDDTHDLELLLRSRIPLIIIETRDEKRVVSLFAGLAISLAMPVMAEKMTHLRAWAQDRTVPAN